VGFTDPLTRRYTPSVSPVKKRLFSSSVKNPDLSDHLEELPNSKVAKEHRRASLVKELDRDGKKITKMFTSPKPQRIVKNYGSEKKKVRSFEKES